MKTMGWIILITAIIVETAFAVYCIRTRSSQPKVRNLIWIAAFLTFALHAATAVLEWGFRYYLLGAVLLAGAIAGAVRLIRPEKEKGAPKTSRIVWNAIGMAGCFSFLAFPSILFPQYRIIETTGAYPVTRAAYTLTDTGRVETYSEAGGYRKLNVEFWYPAHADESFPLVIFSHGAFGMRSSNESLYNELASHGYVVAAIDHTYQNLYAIDESGRMTFVDQGYMNELMTEDAQADRERSLGLYRKWMAVRSGDIQFVLNAILAGADNPDAGEVYRLVDPARIGVMGHSLGGSAALCIGRQRPDVQAVLALESPFMCDIEGVRDGEFVFTEDAYPVPVLNVYSDSTWGRLAGLPQYAKNVSLLSGNMSGSNPQVFNVYLRGTGHLTLTDLALASPILTRVLNGHETTLPARDALAAVNRLSLAFFDRFLKGQGEFDPAGMH